MESKLKDKNDFRNAVSSEISSMEKQLLNKFEKKVIGNINIGNTSIVHYDDRVFCLDLKIKEIKGEEE